MAYVTKITAYMYNERKTCTSTRIHIVWLIAFLEALSLLINDQIKAVLFSYSFFHIWSCNRDWISPGILHERWI